MIPLVACASVAAADVDLAARATNELGLDLYRQLANADQNLCLSPYSIESALAMTFAGAEAETRTEMARVLHFPVEGEAIHSSFDALRRSLADLTTKTTKLAEQSKKSGGPSEPIRMSIANRLFPQTGYNFRDVFKELVHKFYDAPIEPLDFRRNAEPARNRINKWVADQTHERIRDLIPAGGVNAATRLVLANAIYFKGPWRSEFKEALTKPKPFHVHGGAPVDVATMNNRAQFGHARRERFTAVSLPYIGAELQFLILLPDDSNGLRDLEARLTADILLQCARLDPTDVDLSVPKFKLEPPTFALSQQLQSLGMKSAFDLPPGSANFDRMAPRRPDDYLSISEVFHKTFIAVDEKGTEAAAATAVSMMATSARMSKPQPIEVKIDRPFLYAIQHVPSGACLFIGRVTDPR